MASQAFLPQLVLLVLAGCTRVGDPGAAMLMQTLVFVAWNKVFTA